MLCNVKETNYIIPRSFEFLPFVGFTVEPNLYKGNWSSVFPPFFDCVESKHIWKWHIFGWICISTWCWSLGGWEWHWKWCIHITRVGVAVKTETSIGIYCCWSWSRSDNKTVDGVRVWNHRLNIWHVCFGGVGVKVGNDALIVAGDGVAALDNTTFNGVGFAVMSKLL